MHRLLPIFFVAGTLAFAACGGGGGSGPAPVPTLPGDGTTVPLDQKIALTVSIPQATAGILGRARTASASRRANGATTQYLSPNTGSIVLSLALIDGKSPRVVVPTIPAINPAAYCAQALAGCTFTTPANIPAAKGVNQYLVTTYSGADGTGNVISTGFIDVTVPAPNPPTLGNGTLTVGGYVASIRLGSVTPPVFRSGVPGTLGVLLQAYDPAGAAIVGNATYASPITVSVDDSVDFVLSGSSSGRLTVSAPIMTPIPLTYGGSLVLKGQTTVTASTTDENGALATAPPLIATIVGSPPPTAPPPAAPLSLYIDLTDSDTVEEFDFPTQIAAGSAPNPVPTPRRAVGLVLPTQPSTPVCNSLVTNAATGPLGSGTGGVVVSPAGTLYISTGCSINQTQFLNYGFAAGAHGPTSPTLTDSYSVGAGQTVGGPAAIDPATNDVYFGNALGTSAFITGFAGEASSASPSLVFGDLSNAQPPCIFQIPVVPQNPPPCPFPQIQNITGRYADNLPNAIGFSVSQGQVYLPVQNQMFDSNGQQTSLGSAIAIIPTTQSGTVLTPYSALSGSATELGGFNNFPAAATVDGTTLYVLLQPSQDSTTNLYEGLSSCSADPSTNHCADGNAHQYLAAFDILPLLAPGAANTNANSVPKFVIGGDTVGRFGCVNGPNYFLDGGEFLAAKNGYVYVLNTTSSNCAASNVSSEIDVYNTNVVSPGNHVDVAPIYVLGRYSRNGRVPAAIALGPSGPAFPTSAIQLLHRARPHGRSIRSRFQHVPFRTRANF